MALVTFWWIAVWSGSYPIHTLDKQSAASLLVLDQNGFLLRQEANSAGLKEHWVPLQKISQHLIHATIASEDNDFYEHGGVDWMALVRANWLNLRGGSMAYGGSTITMQLVRLTANTKRTIWGKLQQSVLSKRLESELSKQEILEHYLNRVYYGNGAWGAEQAAQRYFGKHADALSVGEATALTVLPRGPSYYNPFPNPQRLLRRRAHILGLMQKHGYLDSEQRELALTTPLSFAKTASHFRAPHFVSFLKERLPKNFQRGATVTSTLDFALQRSVEMAVRTHVNHLTPRNLTQAAVVVLRNSDGAILSMVGSADYDNADKNGAFNGATARLRPGSTLKPFVYGTAMEQRGDTAATLALDVALPKDAHEFYTKDVKSHGFARYRESLAGSYNLSAVHTLQRSGIKAVLGKLRTAGLWTLDKPDEAYDWGLAIGHAEVRLLDLTAAFSTFGLAGRPIAPRAILEAQSADGSRFTEPVRQQERVFSPSIAYILYDILSDSDARKPMFGDKVPMNLPFKVALKTGTTKAYTDLWALGATKEYTVGVWGGNFDGSPTHQIMSVQGATPLLRAVYTAIAARYGDPSEPARPGDIISDRICPLSGKLRGPYCEHHKHEIFVADAPPKETCDWHQNLCGNTTVVYPEQVRPWASFYGRVEEPLCQVASRTSNNAKLHIVYPVDGAHFVLDQHRPSQFQRPPWAAIPHSTDLDWTINGEPAEHWLPRPGEHTLRVSRGEQSDQIVIVYE